jgi:hypothetical protein
MPDPLPPELAHRIEVLERESVGPDFDAASWMWLALLGLMLPIGLLMLGWFL